MRILTKRKRFMGNVKVENENLFRALVCLPLAILFSLLAGNSVMNSGIIIFQVMFVVLAMYFVLSTLGYFALYTNEYFDEKAQSW